MRGWSRDRMRLTVLGIAWGLALLTSTSALAGSVAFPPKEYTRAKGSPVNAVDRFLACRPDRAARFRIDNGPHGTSRVTSGSISLNDSEVVGPKDLNQKTGFIERTVRLRASNVLSVRL